MTITLWLLLYNPIVVKWLNFTQVQILQDKFTKIWFLQIWKFCIESNRKYSKLSKKKKKKKRKRKRKRNKSRSFDNGRKKYLWIKSIYFNQISHIKYKI